MKKKESTDEEKELEKLLEHLTLQNDAFSSSNKLLMNYYKSLKFQMTNIMSLIKAIIHITSSNEVVFNDKENLEIINSCRLSWFESLYNFLNITEKDQETILISPISNINLLDTRFELKMTLIDSKTRLEKEEIIKVFYRNIINSLNLIHDSKKICNLVSEILSLLEDKQNCCAANSFNIYYVRLYTDLCNFEEAILLTNNSNENSLLLNENLNFIESSKYFCFDKCLLFNKYNLRFLVYSQLGNLCWSDRICDMNSQFLQDYDFLFQFDNPKRKLIFNIISSFNQFVSNFVLKSVEQLNIDHSFNPILNFPLVKTNKQIQETKTMVSLSPIEVLNNIKNILSSDILSLNSSFIRPDNNASSSIINSINSFTSCISQGIHLDKIDISSNQANNVNENDSFLLRRSSSNLTTLSEFIDETKQSSHTEQNVNVDFFYENNFYSCEWTLI